MRTMISSMEEDDFARALNAAFMYQCALVGNGQLTENDFADAQKKANGLFRDILRNVQPWTDKARQSEAESLADAYRRMVGDPRDPEFQKKMEADIAAFEALRDVVPEEPPEVKIARLLAEQRERRGQGRSRQTLS